MKSTFPLTGAWLLALACLTACGSDEGTQPQPLTPSTSGVWMAHFVSPPPRSEPDSMKFTMHESNSNVTGSAVQTMDLGYNYFTATVSGTHVHPAVTLTLTGVGPTTGSGSVTGTFTDASTINATMNGFGWVNTLVILIRK